MGNLPPKEAKISNSDGSQAARRPLKMIMGSFYIPKNKISKPLGEDAHFISAAKQTAAVADGVGGWSTKGIDAGKYARHLIANCAAEVAAADGGAFLPEVLHAAFRRTVGVRGSSTFCIVQLAGEVLRSMYVGDSGFMVFRDFRCIYKSPVQQWAFNCPYQLGMEPGSDKPDRAAGAAVLVMEGDIVVVGTDGLMDNMFVRDIEKVLKAAKKTAAPEDLAKQLATAAMYNSRHTWFASPFSVAARAAGFTKTGGKIDDITVIVGRIQAAD